MFFWYDTDAARTLVEGLTMTKRKTLVSAIVAAIIAALTAFINVYAGDDDTTADAAAPTVAAGDETTADEVDPDEAAPGFMGPDGEVMLTPPPADDAATAPDAQ